MEPYNHIFNEGDLVYVESLGETAYVVSFVYDKDEKTYSYTLRNQFTDEIFYDIYEDDIELIEEKGDLQ